MKTIWKFTLDAGRTRQYMPKGSVVLSVNSQRDDICIWAEVDDKEKVEERVFEVFGTGHPIHVDMGIERKFIGTVLLDNGALVFHVYERTGT